MNLTVTHRRGILYKFADVLEEHIAPLSRSKDRICGLVVEFLATDPEARVRFPATTRKKM
jgi:hypothetical protein